MTGLIRYIINIMTGLIRLRVDF